MSVTLVVDLRDAVSSPVGHGRTQSSAWLLGRHNAPPHFLVGLQLRTRATMEYQLGLPCGSGGPPAYRMSRRIISSGMLNHMQLSEVMAPQSGLNVYHQSLVVIDD